MENTFYQNRERFDRILADPRFPFLAPVHQQLLAADATLTDEEILTAYQRFSDCIQTNTFAAAELEWVVIATPCFYRPHLTPRLIRRGILTIMYSFGEEITADDMLDFIGRAVLADGAIPYGGLPPEPGLRWLREVLPTLKELLNQTLSSVIEENRRELESL